MIGKNPILNPLMRNSHCQYGVFASTQNSKTIGQETGAADLHKPSEQEKSILSLPSRRVQKNQVT